MRRMRRLGPPLLTGSSRSFAFLSPLAGKARWRMAALARGSGLREPCEALGLTPVRGQLQASLLSWLCSEPRGPLPPTHGLLSCSDWGPGGGALEAEHSRTGQRAG